MASENRLGQRFLRRASQALKQSLLVVGAISVTGVVAAQAVTRSKLQKALELPNEFVLVLDFEGKNLVEKADANPLAKLRSGKTQLQLSKVTDALHLAGKDKRVCGLTSCISDNQTYAGLAAVQEIRSAVLDFRELKKDAVPSVAYSDSFGESGEGNGTLGYYLASAFDQIYVQQNGLVSFTGFSASTPFLRGLLDKWEIVPQAFAREEYKAVVQQFTDKQYSKANREATQALLRSYVDQIVDDVALSRGLSTEQVSHALHSSPLTVKAATAAGLITGAKYHSEATKRILHNTARQGDPAMLLAAKPSAVLNEVTANLPVEGKLAPVSKGSVQTESEPKSEVSSVVSVQAGDDAADTEGSSHSSALKMLARVEECMLHDRGSKATLITDSPQGVRVNAASRVPLSKYIRALEAEKQQKNKKRRKGIISALTSSLLESSSETPKDESSKPQVAVVTATGQIVAGQGSPASPAGGSQMSSAAVCSDLDAAQRDPAVKAVVFRVDSPGGSAVASDTIWHAVQRVRHAGKPIIVSMGSYAASGGYYISAPATKIVAQPGTLTGSIGVANGKLDVSKAFRNQGINVDCVKVGQNANSQSLFSRFSKKQQTQVNALVDRIYLDFLGKVAEGRGMSLTEVRKIAKGRIWSGKDALERGLVDSLGGLSHAISIAKQEAGLSQEDDAVDIVPYPPPKPLWKQLQESLEGQSPLGISLAISLAQIAESMGLLSATDMEATGLRALLSSATQPELTRLAAAMQPNNQLLSTAAKSYLTGMQTGGVQMLCPPVYVH